MKNDEVVSSVIWEIKGKSPWEFIIINTWKRKQNGLFRIIPRMIEDGVAFYLKGVVGESWVGCKDKNLDLNLLRYGRVLCSYFSHFKFYAAWAEPFPWAYSVLLLKCFGIEGPQGKQTVKKLFLPAGTFFFCIWSVITRIDKVRKNTDGHTLIRTLPIKEKNVLPYA